jgi:hypothetical protein
LLWGLLPLLGAICGAELPPDRLPASILALQESLYRENFQAFVSELKRAGSTLDLRGITSPPFDPALSKQEWAEQFINWIAMKKKLSGSTTEQFRTLARPLLIQEFGKNSLVKLAYVSPLKPVPVTKPLLRSVSQSDLPKASPESDYTFPVREYLDQRVPPSLHDFLKRNRYQVYLHYGLREDALGYHEADGYTETFELQSRAMRRPYLLVRNPVTGDSRLVIASLIGQDATAQITSRLAFIPGLKQVTLVEHVKQPTLFKLNEASNQLKFTDQDRMVIGLTGESSKLLGESKDWERQAITDGGLRTFLYQHKVTGQKMIIARNVYGDEIFELLRPFYDRGMRRFTYVGTTGALDPKLAVGDILVPTAILDGKGGRIPVENDVSNLLPTLPKSVQVRKDIRHGFVQSILEETRSNLDTWAQADIQSLDMEVKRFVEYFRDKPDVQKQVFLVVSDHPRGGQSYSDLNILRPKIMKAIAALGRPVLEQRVSNASMRWSKLNVSHIGRCFRQEIEARMIDLEKSP